MATMPSYFAATDLGLGSDLGTTLIDETEEQRKKRMKEAQRPGVAGQSPFATGMSPAVMSLFGGI